MKDQLTSNCSVAISLTAASGRKLPPAAIARSTSYQETARLVHVAAETGARFVRESVDQDPLDWMLTNKNLFDGRAAIDACREEEGFRRAVLLHGLSVGLDAEPQVLAGIPASACLSSKTQRLLSQEQKAVSVRAVRGGRSGLALYSGSIHAEQPRGYIQIFCAAIVRGSEEFHRRLQLRYGLLLAEQARTQVGFDWSEPLAASMVSQAMAHVLMIAASDPDSDFAEDLDFHVQQRFAS